MNNIFINEPRLNVNPKSEILHSASTSILTNKYYLLNFENKYNSVINFRAQNNINKYVYVQFKIIKIHATITNSFIDFAWVDPFSLSINGGLNIRIDLNANTVIINNLTIISDPTHTFTENDIISFAINTSTKNVKFIINNTVFRKYSYSTNVNIYPDKYVVETIGAFKNPFINNLRYKFKFNELPYYLPKILFEHPQHILQLVKSENVLIPNDSDIYEYIFPSYIDNTSNLFSDIKNRIDSINILLSNSSVDAQSIANLTINSNNLNDNVNQVTPNLNLFIDDLNSFVSNFNSIYNKDIIINASLSNIESSLIVTNSSLNQIDIQTNDIVNSFNNSYNYYTGTFANDIFYIIDSIINAENTIVVINENLNDIHNIIIGNSNLISSVDNTVLNIIDSLSNINIAVDLLNTNEQTINDFINNVNPLITNINNSITTITDASNDVNIQMSVVYTDTLIINDTMNIMNTDINSINVEITTGINNDISILNASLTNLENISDDIYITSNNVINTIDINPIFNQSIIINNTLTTLNNNINIITNNTIAVTNIINVTDNLNNDIISLINSSITSLSTI